MITKEYLKSLRPCADRFENYLCHYAKWSGSLAEFLELEKISHTDKVWVFTRSIDKEKQRLFAADCAESVLHIFESKYPNDDRPRKVIQVARSKITDAADAADAARAASRAARAAADAAARAASRAADAAYAAAYAAADAAAYAAAAYAAYAADACALEQQKQIELMKKYARDL